MANKSTSNEPQPPVVVAVFEDLIKRLEADSSIDSAVIVRLRAAPIRKRQLTDRQLIELETANIPPAWVGLAVRQVDRRWNIYVPALYWGVFHLLRRMTERPRHMRHAQALLARYRF